LITAWYFEEKEYSIETWRQFYEWVVKILYDKDPLLMKSFMADPALSYKFFDHDEAWWILVKLSDNLYLKVGNSTEEKLSALRIMFERYEISPDDLSFYINWINK
jgi:hypothetical protein